MSVRLRTATNTDELNPSFVHSLALRSRSNYLWSVRMIMATGLLCVLTPGEERASCGAAARTRSLARSGRVRSRSD